MRRGRAQAGAVRSFRSRIAVAPVLAASLGMLLVACTGAPDAPTVALPSARPSAAPLSATPTPPRPAGTATPAETVRESARFDAVNERTLRSTRSPGGRAFIDALVEAGFRRSDMQVTEDRTTVGLPVPSVQFSVLWRGVCLIGQDGPESGGYHGAAVAPIDGRCLIGRTRAIDW